MHCINCGANHAGEVCPGCGRTNPDDRLTPRHYWREILQSFDLDRGLFQTALNMLVRPGPVIRGYVNRTHDLYGPVKFVLVTGAMLTFLTFKFHLIEDQDPIFNFGLPHEDVFSHFSGQYFSLTNFIAVPIFAFFTWLLFRSSRLNYIENLVLNTYICAGQFLISILLSPILIPYHTGVALNAWGIINLVYNIWVLVAFFNVPWLSGSFRALLSIILSYVPAYLLNYAVSLVLAGPLMGL